MNKPQPKPSVTMFAVPSHSRKGVHHVVKCDATSGEKDYSCNCENFIYRNPARVPCKHIIEVIQRKHESKTADEINKLLNPF